MVKPSTDSIIELCLTNHGIDPSLIYCRHTGRPFARLMSSELDDLIQCLGVTDAETIADDLAIRAIAASRPSPAWISYDPVTLNQYRHVRPMELMAYLLNRLYEPQVLKQSNKSFDYYLDVISDKITRWQVLNSLTYDTLTMRRLLLVLLVIDSRFGLSNLSSQVEKLKIQPFTINLRMEQLASRLEAICRQMMAKSRDSEYRAGNKLTRVAAFHEYVDAPAGNSNLDPIAKKPAPKRKNAVKEKRLRRGQAFFDTLMGNKTLLARSLEKERELDSKAAAAAPSPAPSGPAKSFFSMGA